MTNEEIQVHLQKSRELFVRIEVLNQSNITIGELQGLAIDGNINIDNSSAIRRTCDITFTLKPILIPSPSSPIWLNKRFKLFIGIKNIITDSIVWFDQGIYLINDPEIDITISDKTINIKGLDLMAYHSGDISGESSTNIVIDKDISIHEAIKSTMKDIGKELESNMIIETSPYTTPYKIEKNIGTTVYEVIKELTELYMSYECFYDINGRFIFRKRKDLINDLIFFDFTQYPLSTQITNNFKFSNVKNYIKVWGRLRDDGSQPSAEIIINNSNYPDSPFTVEKLGEPKTRDLIITEDSYFEQEQCQQRAEYEKYLHTNLAELISISCLPIYFLTVNKLIYVKNDESGVEGKYGIDKLNIPLKHDGLMSIVAHKVY